MPQRRGDTRKKTAGKKKTPATKKTVAKTVTVRSFSPQKIAAMLEKQRLQRQAINTQKSKQREAKKKVERAREAIAKFRPLKKDRGQLVFIGAHGQRDAADKGRKGYLVYVTKTGKKQFIKQKRNGYSTSKFADVQPPISKKYARQSRAILEQRLRRKQDGKPVLVSSGKIIPRGDAGFSDTVVEKLTRAIGATMRGKCSVRAQRRFVIRLMVNLDVPNSGNRLLEDGNAVTPILIPIEKADNIAIELGGIENFVRKKFYAFMAQYLAFHGYVTTGSANHIRNLKANKGKSPAQWVRGDGAKWGKHKLDVVRIKALEYRIERVKFTKQ